MGLAVFSVVVVGLLFAWMEIPALRRQKRNKELVLYLVLLSVATALNAIKAFDIELPSPLLWITALYKPVSDLLKGWLT